MMPTCTLRLTQQVHGPLQRHLFPGDDKEAAAVLVCTRVPGARSRLLVRDFIAVPHDKCSRRDAVSLTWPSDYIEQAIDLAEHTQQSLILLHSTQSRFRSAHHLRAGRSRDRALGALTGIERAPARRAAGLDLHGAQGSALNDRSADSTGTWPECRHRHAESACRARATGLRRR
jgi:hypothetical protein